MENKKNERKEERDIKYNEKDIFTHIFNRGKREVVTAANRLSSSGLSDNF